MSQPKVHKATFYLQVHRESQTRYVNGKGYVTATAKGITQNKPTSTPKDTVTVKLTVELPDEAFEPFEPSATIVVPANLVQGHPIHVIAEDAS